MHSFIHVRKVLLSTVYFSSRRRRRRSNPTRFLVAAEFFFRPETRQANRIHPNIYTRLFIRKQDHFHVCFSDIIACSNFSFFCGTVSQRRISKGGEAAFFLLLDLLHLETITGAEVEGKKFNNAEGHNPKLILILPARPWRPYIGMLFVYEVWKVRRNSRVDKPRSSAVVI